MDSQGLRYEADQRHGEIIVEQLGLSEKGATVSTPGAKPDPIPEEEDPLLTGPPATQYRAMAYSAANSVNFGITPPPSNFKTPIHGRGR